MLDRIGDEVARATSVVRYEAGRSFPEHTHDMGEEFLVLHGVFSDEHGDYPAGTYVRNPPGSSHKPYTKDGCTIFVKLRQFDPSDTKRVVIDAASADFLPGHVAGIQALLLHDFGNVSTALLQWEPGTVYVPRPHRGGEEILVLEGDYADDHGIRVAHVASSIVVVAVVVHRNRQEGVLSDLTEHNER